MKAVTEWYRGGKGTFSYNHLEDGHLTGVPTRPQFANTKQKEWVYRHSYLTADTPPKVVLK